MDIDLVHKVSLLVLDDRISLSSIASKIGYSERQTERIIHLIYGFRFAELKRTRWYFRLLKSVAYLNLHENKVSSSNVSVKLGYEQCSNRFYIICKEIFAPDIHYEEKISAYLTRKVYKMKKYERLTQNEFELLKREILLQLMAGPATLKDLVDITDRSKAYVLAAIKDLETPSRHIVGMHVFSKYKGYSIAELADDRDALIDAHDNWVGNWKASVGIISD